MGTDELFSNDVSKNENVVESDLKKRRVDFKHLINGRPLVSTSQLYDVSKDVQLTDVRLGECLKTLNYLLDSLPHSCLSKKSMQRVFQQLH
jgi:hypothetical protein